MNCLLTIVFREGITIDNNRTLWSWQSRHCSIELIKSRVQIQPIDSFRRPWLKPWYWFSLLGFKILSLWWWLMLKVSFFSKFGDSRWWFSKNVSWCLEAHVQGRLRQLGQVRQCLPSVHSQQLAPTPTSSLKQRQRQLQKQNIERQIQIMLDTTNLFSMIVSTHIILIWTWKDTIESFFTHNSTILLAFYDI